MMYVVGNFKYKEYAYLFSHMKENFEKLNNICDIIIK